METFLVKKKKSSRTKQEGKQRDPSWLSCFRCSLQLMPGSIVHELPRAHLSSSIAINSSCNLNAGEDQTRSKRGTYHLSQPTKMCLNTPRRARGTEQTYCTTYCTVHTKQAGETRGKERRHNIYSRTCLHDNSESCSHAIPRAELSTSRRTR